MVKNDKDYMRAYQAQRRAKLKAQKLESLQVKSKEIVKNENWVETNPTGINWQPKCEKIIDEAKINHNLAESVRNGKRPTPLHLLQELDLELLLTGVNNYLKGYRTAYNNNKNDPTSEVARKYERFIKEKEKLENILK